MGHSANIHTGRHPSLLLVWSHDTLSLKCIEHSVPLIHLFHMRWFTVSTLYLQAWLLALPFWNQRERREPSCVCGTNSWSFSILLLLAALCCKPASPHRNHNDRDSSQRPEVGVKSIAAQCVTAVAMARRSKPSTITPTITPTPLLRAAELNLTSSPPVRLCISTFTTRASGEVACCSERGCKESGGFQKLSHSSPLLSWIVTTICFCHCRYNLMLFSRFRQNIWELSQHTAGLMIAQHDAVAVWFKGQNLIINQSKFLSTDSSATVKL